MSARHSVRLVLAAAGERHRRRGAPRSEGGDATARWRQADADEAADAEDADADAAARLLRLLLICLPLSPAHRSIACHPHRRDAAPLPLHCTAADTPRAVGRLTASIRLPLPRSARRPSAHAHANAHANANALRRLLTARTRLGTPFFP